MLKQCEKHPLNMIEAAGCAGCAWEAYHSEHARASKLQAQAALALGVTADVDTCDLVAVSRELRQQKDKAEAEAKALAEWSCADCGCRFSASMRVEADQASIRRCSSCAARDAWMSRARQAESRMQELTALGNQMYMWFKEQIAWTEKTGCTTAVYPSDILEALNQWNMLMRSVFEPAKTSQS